MIAPALRLLPHSPVAVGWVVSNRVATATGLAVLWNRLRQTCSLRRFILVAVAINLVSWAALLTILRLLP